MSLADLQLSEFVTGLWSQAAFVVDPSKRIFYGSLISSLLLALFWLHIRGIKSPKALLKKLFSRRYLLHESSRLDFKLFWGNALIRVLFIAPYLASVTTIGYFILRICMVTFGEAPKLDISPLAIAVLFSLSAFIVEDFFRFFVHYLFHKIPLLWEFHKVHHSAVVLTPLTLYRIHPMESTVNALRNAFSLGLVSGVFYYLFGSSLSGLDILGVDAFGFLFNLLGSNLRHSHIYLSFGPLEHIFISPAQHQIHHGRHPKHYDRNFGVCFSFWDRLFGSLMLARETTCHRFGLAAREMNHRQNMVSAYLGPVKAAFVRGLRPLKARPKLEANISSGDNSAALALVSSRVP